MPEAIIPEANIIPEAIITRSRAAGRPADHVRGSIAGEGGAGVRSSK
jgi:hypothetical protein